MHEKVTVARAGVETVDDLRPLFLALHRHHRSVADLPLVADDEAWRARRETYLAWFAEGRALLFVASAEEAPVGYALVVWHEGADDTFPLAPRYAEIYTLSVAEQARGAGVGARCSTPSTRRSQTRATRHSWSPSWPATTTPCASTLGGASCRANCSSTDSAA